MIELLKLAVSLIEDIVSLSKKGVSDEEILERISRPGGIGRKLIEAAKTRSDSIEDYIRKG